jgi:hypothetical protein
MTFENNHELDPWSNLIGDIFQHINKYGYDSQQVIERLSKHPELITPRAIRFLEGRGLEDQESFVNALQALLEFLSFPDWKQELIVRDFSSTAIDVFERLAFRKLGRKDDVLILHFSRSVPLGEIAELESVINNLYREESSKFTDRELPDRVIYVRKVTYRNPVEIILVLGIAFLVGNAGYIGFNVFQSIRARRKASGVIKQPQEVSPAMQAVDIDAIPEGVIGDGNELTEHTAHVIEQTATGSEDRQDAEKPIVFGMVSEGFVGIAEL